MPSAGFEPAIPVIDPLQTYALDRAATAIGMLLLVCDSNFDNHHL